MVIEEVFQHWSQTLCTTAIHNYKMLVSVVRILSAILLKEKQTFFITLTDKSLKLLLLILKFSKKKGKNIFSIAIGLLHNQHNHCGKLEWLSSEFPKQIYWSKRTGSCKKSKLESHTTITTEGLPCKKKKIREHEIMCNFQIPVSNKLQALFY